MVKKLYFKVSDNEDMSEVTMFLSECMSFILSDIETALFEKEELKEYTLLPVWLTDEEIKNLPEATV